MKCICTGLLFWLSVGTVFAQSAISVDSLFRLAERNYPSVRQRALTERGGRLADLALRSAYLPKATVVGAATFQSEVTEINVPGPSEIPQAKKDQYHAGVELSQTIYDAGITRASREIQAIQTATQLNDVEGDLLAIKGTVLDVAVSIASARLNIAQLRNTIADLEQRAGILQVNVDNGTALPVTRDELDVEILQLRQQIIGLQANVRTGFASLEILVDLPAGDTADIRFGGPDPAAVAGAARGFDGRYDVENLRLARDQLVLRKRLLDRQALPRVTVFANGYYGRPGYNFLDNDFRTYGMAGVNLSFPITSLAYNRPTLEGLRVSSESLGVDREKLERQLRVQDAQLAEQIVATRAYLGTDSLLLAKRERILGVVQIQFDNGTLLASDYLDRLFDRQGAEIQLEIHRLQLRQLYIKRDLLHNR